MKYISMHRFTLNFMFEATVDSTFSSLLLCASLFRFAVVFVVFILCKSLSFYRLALWFSVKSVDANGGNKRRRCRWTGLSLEESFRAIGSVDEVFFSFSFKLWASRKFDPFCVVRVVRSSNCIAKDDSRFWVIGQWFNVIERIFCDCFSFKENFFFLKMLYSMREWRFSWWIVVVSDFLGEDDLIQRKIVEGKKTVCDAFWISFETASCARVLCCYFWLRKKVLSTKWTSGRFDVVLITETSFPAN